MTQRIFFSVGEPSGDLHAGNLIRALRAQNDLRSSDQQVHCRGFGGVKMIQAGFECDFDLTQMAVVGITEVLPKLREFFRIADQASAIFRSGEVDAVVLVDFPGFNWHIAKRAKSLGLPVFYYLPPQLWAWGGWRIAKVKKYVDRVLCTLPFEAEWFENHGMKVDYVGHPFFDDVASKPLDPRFLHRWNRNDRLQVAVLPGSRDHEVHQIWPLQLQVIRNLHREFPKVEFMVAALKDAHALWCRQQMSDEDSKLPIEIFVGKTSELLHLSDCAFTKSGSVSLEMMARGTPAVVLYRVSPLTYTLGKMLAQCDSMTLPNLIGKEKIMPEFLSSGSPRKAIAWATEEMRRMIGDSDYRQQARSKLLELSNRFAQPGASQNAAKLLLESIGQNSGHQAAGKAA